MNIFQVSRRPKQIDENTGGKQVLGKDAEKYLREVASIEDVPDEQDQHDMDETIDKNKNS